ncbi:hypothetical protein PJI17_32395, partial [Mycobacterium kansasii]
ITIEVDSEAINNLFTTLRCFEVVSGMRINLSKSKVFGINVSENELNRYAHPFECSPASFPTLFVSLPLAIGASPTSMWDKVVD